jgi:membrane protease YdiL (CAAX protease family)
VHTSRSVNPIAVWLELAVIGAVFAIDRPEFDSAYFSKILYIGLLAAVSLQLRNRWGDVGLRLGPNFGLVVLFGLIAGGGMELLYLFVTQPLLGRLYGATTDLSDFTGIRGNYEMLTRFLILTWTVGAFGEEFVYRGYLMNRLRDLFAGGGRSTLAATVALIISSQIFGVANLHQGAPGVIEAVIKGLILGGIYFASGRRLWVPIIAHGVQDSADFLLIFWGLYPT